MLSGDGFLPDDLPAALAPFEAFHPDGLLPLASLLEKAAGDYSISLDRIAGQIIFQGQSGRVTVYPWMLLADGPDRQRELAQFAPADRATVARAIIKAWDWMVADLAGEVACEKWHVLAREDRPHAPLSILPAGAWALFEIEDWERGTAICQLTGDRLFDVHFRLAATQTTDLTYEHQLVLEDPPIKDHEKILSELSKWAASRPNDAPRLGAEEARLEMEKSGLRFNIAEFRKAYPQVCGRIGRGRPRRKID